MKLFIRKLLAFGTAIFLTIIFLQLAILYRINGKSLYGTDNLELTSSIDADLVFLGSSRCLNHFDPHFFDSTFKLKSINIAVSGHSEIAMAIVRLKDYLLRNKPPKYAILSLDPLMKPGSETNNTNFVHKDRFARYAFFPKKKNLFIVNYFKYDFHEKYVPLYSIFKYNLLSPIIFFKNDNTYVKYGYGYSNNYWDTVKTPITKEINNHYWKEYEIPSIINALDTFKRFCSNNNIKLMCIQTPVYRVLHDDVTFSRSSFICKALNIPFIDANQEYIRNDIDNFFNSNHMNSTGVKEMNNFLKKNSILTSFLNSD